MLINQTIDFSLTTYVVFSSFSHLNERVVYDGLENAVIFSFSVLHLL